VADMMLATFDDVIAAMPVELQGAMSEGDIRDILLAVRADPSAGPDLLAAYKAANATIPESVWAKIWDVLVAAAQVGSVITSIGGAAAMVPR
jgi:hypothetical protein